MCNQKTLAILLMSSLCIFLGIILFANSLGLDTNTSWGRARSTAFAINLLAIILAAIFTFAPNKIEQAIVKLFRKTLNKLSSIFISQEQVNTIRSYFFTLPAIAFVIITYIWLVSSGTWAVWNSPTRYYANLARGFANGTLYIPGKPDPRLEKLTNPYDPTQRVGINVPVDVSYYHGKYYLYWGPVPSLLLVPIQSIYHGRVGDLQLTFFFTCGIFLLLSALIINIWNLFFSQQPKWLLLISILLVGMAGPTLFMLNNFKGARIYEAAIAGGQFFLIAGLFTAVTTLGKPVSYWKSLLIGILWALSIGTRLFLIIPIGAISVTLVYFWFSEKRKLTEKITQTLFLLIPIIFGGIALGWYNWARFGSVTESGLYYQLAGPNLQKNYSLLIHRDYFIQNLYNYLFQPFENSTQFPFISVRNGITTPILLSYILPPIYNSQQITGILFSTPFVILSLIPIFLLFTQSRNIKSNQYRNLNWISFLLGISTLTAFLFLMLFFWAAMRYIDDFMPSLLTLSTIGLWQGYATWAHKPMQKKLFTIFSVTLASTSLLLSFLIAISINDARFEIIRFFYSK